MQSLLSRALHFFQDFIPASFDCFQKDYTKKTLYHDIVAGLSIGIISLPLVMAFAIASGLPPERGLFTGIVGGLLVSLLGGSRFQIAGPTGAFVVIVYGIVERHGYEGLALSTLMAGGLLILFGLAKAGRLLKYIPFPVIVGFTAGIALSLFSSQIKDFFGLPIAQASPDFIEKWTQYFYNFPDWNPWASAIGLGCLALIFLFKAIFPKVPGMVAAIGFASLLVYLLDLPVETIQTRFGAIPSMLPAPSLSFFSWEKLYLLFPDALTVALLSSIESVLSCSVADGMTGTRHNPNTELLSQGIANAGSALFGGIPVTGAIARTAANIKIGARTPLAGIIHAATLFFFMVFLADETAKIPLTALAASLMYIAWSMSERAHIKAIFKGPKSDILLLASSFILTVLVDITVAVEVGVVIAALLFTKKMADHTEVKEAREHPISQEELPEHVAVFEVTGPLFYGIALSFNDRIYAQIEKPEILILRLDQVTLIDASGIHALHELIHTSKSKGIKLFITGVNGKHEALFRKTGIEQAVGRECLFSDFSSALAKSVSTLHTCDTSTSKQPIMASFQEILSDIPNKELDKLPSDSASELDHYLYGKPKKKNGMN